MADNASAPTQAAQASAPTSGANGGLTPDDHFNNMVRALSSGAALVKIGFNQIRSYLTPTPTPQLPSRSVPSVCQHMLDLYADCNENHSCKKYFAPLVKYCTVLGSPDFKVAGYKITEEITTQEAASVMPIPFRIILWSFYGCIEKKPWDPLHPFACLDKYAKLMETVVDADQNSVPSDKVANEHQSMPASTAE